MIGCFGGFGPCFCALIAAMGGRGNDGGSGFLAAGGAEGFAVEIGGAKGGKGWMEGACLGAWPMGASGALPIVGTTGGASVGRGDAANGAGGAGRDACNFGAGAAETGDALCAAAAAREFKLASM